MDREVERLVSSPEVLLLSEALEKNQKYQLELLALFTRVDKLLRRNKALQRQAKFKPTIFEEIKSSKAFVSFVDKGSAPCPNPDACEREQEWNPKSAKKWFEREINDLKKGVLQQFQAAALQSFYNSAAQEDVPLWRVEEEANTLKTLTIDDVDETNWAPNWEEISDTWVRTRTPVECEIKWRNDHSLLFNRGDWTKEEDQLLFNLVKKKGKNNWQEISSRMTSSPRSPLQCSIRYQRSLNPTFVKKEWTKKDDDQLREAVKRNGTKDWSLVASEMEGWKGKQCYLRWISTVDPSIKRGRFSEEEDMRVALGVKVYGEKWSKVAAHVPGRTGPQVRERWLNVLNPHRLFSPWSEEEDKKLLTFTKEIEEGKWSKISEAFDRRTDNECWRRWKQLVSEEELEKHKELALKRKMMIKNVRDKGWRTNLSVNDMVVPKKKPKRRRVEPSSSSSSSSSSPPITNNNRKDLD